MTERKCACNKLFSILVRGPNTEADEKSAYNNVQVGEGPTHEISKRNSTGNSELGSMGPNTGKLTKSQLTIMCKLGMNNVQVGEGPNTENFEKKFYRQCELGCGPQHRS
ncbi:hypothetical protein D3W98_07500 [Staphylococcus aureus subsp. aureus]|nr:hypothetical protein [Staphylococcus aureus]